MVLGTTLIWCFFELLQQSFGVLFFFFSQQFYFELGRDELIRHLVGLDSAMGCLAAVGRLGYQI
jgi:hypothetical protein